MTRKPLTAALALGMSLAATAHANEGMWMPTQLPELARTLKEAGFKGDPKQLADVTAPRSARWCGWAVVPARSSPTKACC